MTVCQYMTTMQYFGLAISIIDWRWRTLAGQECRSEENWARCTCSFLKVPCYPGSSTVFHYLLLFQTLISLFEIILSSTKSKALKLSATTILLLRPSAALFSFWSRHYLCKCLLDSTFCRNRNWRSPWFVSFSYRVKIDFCFRCGR